MQPARDPDHERDRFEELVQELDAIAGQESDALAELAATIARLRARTPDTSTFDREAIWRAVEEEMDEGRAHGNG